MTPASLLAVGAAIACLTLALVALWRDWRSFVHRSFAAGMTLLAVERGLAALSLVAATPESLFDWQRLRLLALSLLPGAWLSFSLAYGRPDYRAFLRRWRWALVATLTVPAALALVTGFGTSPALVFDAEDGVLQFAWPGRALYLALLLGAVLILANLERTFRSSTGAMRWAVKFMVLGVGAIFAVRIYSSSYALLYRVIDPSLDVLHSAAALAAAALVTVSVVRSRVQQLEIHVSETVIYNSVTVLVVGAYLIVVGIAANAVRVFGGVRALPLTMLVVFAALLGLVVVLLSDDLRLRARRFLGRHFARPRYDYRREWLAFTHRTTSILDVRSLCLAVARAVSETLSLPAVSVWLFEEKPVGISLGASTVFSEERGLLYLSLAPPAEQLLELLKRGPLPVDVLGALRAQGREPDARGLEVLPEGRFGLPLASGGEHVGFITFGAKVSEEPLSEEDQELIRTLADQATASILNLRLAERLARAREMEAFQSLSAFFIHDLKNLASRLSLTMQNLPAHYDDPAFREDLLSTIQRSVEKINLMCTRLSPLSRRLELAPSEADLAEVVREALAGLEAPLRARLVPDLRPVRKAPMDPEEIQKVVVNLVLNAQEASGPLGEIRVATGEQDGWVFLSVSDDGCGMSSEFVARSLFQPFQTTKAKGLGIGLFHCRKVVEAHRGRIEVESQKGEGSTFTVKLPAAMP